MKLQLNALTLTWTFVAALMMTAHGLTTDDAEITNKV